MRNGGQRVDALGSILGLVAVLCSSTRHLPQGLRVKGGGGGRESPGWANIPFWGYNQYLWLLYATEAPVRFDSLSTKHKSRFYLNILKG